MCFLPIRSASTATSFAKILRFLLKHAGACVGALRVAGEQKKEATISPWRRHLQALIACHARGGIAIRHGGKRGMA